MIYDPKMIPPTRATRHPKYQVMYDLLAKHGYEREAASLVFACELADALAAESGGKVLSGRARLDVSGDVDVSTGGVVNIEIKRVEMVWLDGHSEKWT